MDYVNVLNIYQVSQLFNMLLMISIFYSNKKSEKLATSHFLIKT